MFKKILVANRGEIACRVIRTAHRMGIGTVAVYSDADAGALHVKMAEEAVHIGAAPSASSYLVIENILEALKQTGAEAVHPGYGFLSENAAFAHALNKAGVAFIGPGVKAIEIMGDKIQSKKFASKAGISTVPGYPDEVKDSTQAIRVAGDIGYPVMIKASAGGGGKGMRIAWSEKDVEEGFLSSVNEAQSSFGDSRVFIEKYVTGPRHIEIQIVADKHGDVVYLGERECSIQRRNQKVIEEAPSPFLDEQTRASMGAQAVALARAVDYESAGTVEFIVDSDKNFYFLEMNTRLQVEHPVSELVSGIDLVEQMIRVAAGEKLSIRQEDIQCKGWAMESRVYAEDPRRNFFPSTGRLVRFQAPAEGTGNGVTVRNDTGVGEGDEISLYYDPMIAKLCTHAPTRKGAIEAMLEALDEFFIEGIRHNIPFLSAIMEHPRFQEGNLTTGFIADEYPDGFSGVTLEKTRADRLVAVVAFINEIHARRAVSVSGRLPGRARHIPGEWIVTLGEGISQRVRVFQGRESLVVSFLDGGGGEGNVVDEFQVASDWRPGQNIWRGKVNGVSLVVQLSRAKDRQGYTLGYRGSSVEATVHTLRAHELFLLMPEKQQADTSRLLLCPMPGLVVAVHVGEGEEVKAGDVLAVVEAMKMENTLRAEYDGVVKAVKAMPGDTLQVDDVILEFDA